MQKWSVEFRPRARDDFVGLDRQTRKQVAEKVNWLAENFDEILPIPLSGEFAGFYKLRIGDWRAMYKADWNATTLVIYYIDHRSRIYKKRK